MGVFMFYICLYLYLSPSMVKVGHVVFQNTTGCFKVVTIQLTERWKVLLVFQRGLQAPIIALADPLAPDNLSSPSSMNYHFCLAVDQMQLEILLAQVCFV